MVTPIMVLLSTSILCINSMTWLIMWATLELNSVSFLIQLMKEAKKEKLLIFFIFQSMASILLMMFLTYTYSMKEQTMSFLMAYLLVISIMLKIGMFPFHMWMITVAKNFHWFNLTTMLTWQKLIPILIMIKMTKKTNIMVIMILTMLMSMFLLMSFSSTKKMILTSSIIQNSWIFMLTNMLKNLSILYLLMYSIILWLTNNYLMKKNIKEIYNQIKEKNKNNNIMLMMSLSGMPPSMGFTMKMMVMYSLMMMKTEMYLMLILMLITLMGFFVYFKIFLKSFMLKKNTKKMMKSYKKNKFNTTLLINLTTPPIIFMK